MFPLEGWFERLLALLVTPSDVVHQGSLYMRRFRFHTRWFGVRLHHIYREDVDPDMHDHPFSFLSLILWGWYLEELLVDPSQKDGQRCLVRRRWFNWCRGPDLHRIVELSGHTRGVWTLVLTGPWSRDWGFWVKGKGWVYWRDYVPRG